MTPKLTLKQYADLIRANFPTRKPVILRTGYLKDEGSIAESEKSFYITVSRMLPLPAQKEALLHEYAHAKAGWTDKRQHTDAWGIWYAKMYRKLYDEAE